MTGTIKIDRRVKYRNMKHRLHDMSALDGNGCYIWLGAKNHAGYGTFNIRRDGKHVQMKAHRVAFEEHCRPLEPGEEVDHLCYNRACINPDHLEAVTKSENLARRRKKK